MKRTKLLIIIVAIIVSISCASLLFYVNYDSTEYVIDDIYKDDTIIKGTFYIKDPYMTLDYLRENITYPNNGYVPNEITAAKIAEAVWLSKYGERIYNQKPYRVNLIKDSIWVVNGSISGGGYGENAYIEIRKKDGKILKVLMGC